MKKNHLFLYAVTVFLLVFQTSCFRKFYSTNSITTVTAADIDQAIAQRRHFILHYVDTVMGLDRVELREGILHAQTLTLPTSSKTALNPRAADENLMAGRDKDEVLSQAHLYLNERFSGAGNNTGIVVPLTSFMRMDRYGLDKAATDKSTTGSILGILIPVVVLVGLGIAVSNTSFGFTW